MADQSLGTLSAQIGANTTALKRAEREVRNLTSRMEREMNQMAKTGTRSTGAVGAGWSKMAKGVAGAAGAFFSVTLAIQATNRALQESIRLYAAFEKEMKVVQVTSQATGAEMERMTTLAREMGRTTEFTGTQSAEALRFLSMAGLTASESMEALPQMLDLATAGSIGLGEAADIATNILSQMGMEVSELSDVSDTLVAVQASANTNILEAAQAFVYAGTMAKKFNTDVTELSAMIGIMANNGIKASMAGTTLRQAMMDLLDPSDKAAAILDRYGINVTKADGSIRDFIDILYDLADANLNATETIQLFGARGQNISLVLDEGREGIRRYVAELRSMDGMAEQAADTIRDSLWGQLKALESAAQSVGLALGEELEGGLVDVIDAGIRLLNHIESELIPQFGSLGSAISDVVETADTLISAFRGIKQWGDKVQPDWMDEILHADTKGLDRLVGLIQKGAQATGLWVGTGGELGGIRPTWTKWHRQQRREGLREMHPTQGRWATETETEGPGGIGGRLESEHSIEREVEKLKTQWEAAAAEIEGDIAEDVKKATTSAAQLRLEQYDKEIEKMQDSVEFMRATESQKQNIMAMMAKKRKKLAEQAQEEETGTGGGGGADLVEEQQQRNKEILRLQKSLTGDIKRQTMERLEYKLWAFDQEKKAIKESEAYYVASADTKAEIDSLLSDKRLQIEKQINDEIKEERQKLYDHVSRMGMTSVERMQSNLDGMRDKIMETFGPDSEVMNMFKNFQEIELDITGYLGRQQEYDAKLDYLEDYITQRYEMLEKAEGGERRLIKNHLGALEQEYRNIRIAELEMNTDIMSGIERAALKMRNEWEDAATSVENMMNSLAGHMTDAIVDFVDTGTFEFEKFARSVLKDLMRIATQKLVVAAISTATSLIGIADGAAFSGGGGNMIQAYGDGGAFTNTVVDKPTMFRYGGGLGVMGEAGPEAIMPLQRGPDGKLGVSAQGGGQQRPVIDGRFVFQFDRENLVGDYLTTPEGGRALVKAVRENGEEIRAVLQ